MKKRAALRLGLFSLAFSISCLDLRAQTVQNVISELHRFTDRLVATECNTGRGNLISYQAMNIFLSEKVSSYLSDNNDLSLYKNYVTLNGAKGVIAINHNFHQPVAKDDYVRSFFIVGARAAIANAYASRFTRSYANNQLGINFQQVWMGRPVTLFECAQKQEMDAKRAFIVEHLAAGAKTKAAAFENELANISTHDVPGQGLQSAREKLSGDFYSSLREELLQQFAQEQSDLLIKSNNYKMIKDYWTILSAYVPVIRQKFNVVNGNAPVTRHGYPAELLLTHTRFWAAPKIGRIFFSLITGISVNNSVQAGQLDKPAADGIYSGGYSQYVNPLTAAKLVFLPVDSHVGLSFRIDKNYGKYRALNGILGIPIVLIDKKGVPAVNFECQLIFDDLNHSVHTLLPGNRTSVGLTLGIPFSKIVY